MKVQRGGPAKNLNAISVSDERRQKNSWSKAKRKTPISIIGYAKETIKSYKIGVPAPTAGKNGGAKGVSGGPRMKGGVDPAAVKRTGKKTTQHRSQMAEGGNTKEVKKPEVGGKRGERH